MADKELKDATERLGLHQKAVCIFFNFVECKILNSPNRNHESLCPPYFTQSYCPYSLTKKYL